MQSMEDGPVWKILCKTLLLDSIKHSFPKLWQLKRLIHVIDITDGFFYFKFQSKERNILSPQGIHCIGGGRL